MSTDSVLSLKNVYFSYGGPLILENVSLDLYAGEFLGLVGPNGGGKSTLLKIILGLLRAAKGRVTLFGGAPARQRTALGYVPQFAGFGRDFPISVEETVLLGRLGHGHGFFGYRRGDYTTAERVMQETGITSLRRRAIGTLSGGQLQRVLIARALACEPKVLILDEPTANVDMRAEEDIFGLLKQLNQRLSIILVSHDIGFISQYVHRVACLNRTLLCHHTDKLDCGMIQDLYHEPVRAIHHTHSHLHD